ncbi:MAG: toxic anion resistance protein, partial [bacterium]
MALTLDAPANGAAMEPQPFDIAADQRATLEKLAGSDEIDALTSQLDVYDMTSIVTFGSAAAEKISKASDDVLRSMSLSQLDDPGGLMTALAKIMEQ